MATNVTENKESNVDVAHPSVEIVQFSTAASGDYYDCKKISHVDGAFASQSTTDGVDLQITWAEQSNGRPRISITPEAGTAFTGYLTIFGRL